MGGAGGGPMRAGGAPAGFAGGRGGRGSPYTRGGRGRGGM